jgi:hypothetical protein
MKKGKWFFALMLVPFLLAACKVASNSSASGSTNAEQGAMSRQEQLLIGTLKLEESDLAIDQTQAAALLILWQAYKELMSNNATAPEELDAVVSQIESSMSSDQLKAITDMKLTFQDVRTTMTDLGITFTLPAGNGTQMAPGQGFGGDFGGAPVGGGGGPMIINDDPGGPPSEGGRFSSGGGFQGGGQGMITSGNISPEQMATLQAGGGKPSQGSGRIPTLLIDALINVLQKRTQN